ncbi:MAG: tRNA 2-thiouridine(34) synthase MnmA [Coriobacteriia bacterium]|nr:tRNA 2-thiouridine(34) synthase MnmA [Coriobacteriia bacterium]
MFEKREKTALLAMSGGLDSSVCAYLLLEAGFEVVGVTMRLHDNPALLKKEEQDIQDAQEVARILGFEHKVVDLRERFSEIVISNFCESYMKGLTPNPCVLCNKTMKFGSLHEMRKELGLEFLATGHYAHIEYSSKLNRYVLKQAKDKKKDQSYVLYHLSQDALGHTYFPLGNLLKEEAREIAKKLGFSVSQKSESQDICFVLNNDYSGFIQERTNKEFLSGDIYFRNEKVGEHHGLIRYTIGQRKGIGVAYSEPLYVVQKDLQANRLIIGTKDELDAQTLYADDLNFIPFDTLKGTQEVVVKTHYGKRGQKAQASLEESGLLKVCFVEPQGGFAPGQAAVMYQGEYCIGGGTIVK